MIPDEVDRTTPGSPARNARDHDEISRLESRARIFSAARLAAFGVAVGGPILLSSSWPLAAGACLAGAGLFVALVLAHGRTLDARDRARETHILAEEAAERQASRGRPGHAAPVLPGDSDLARGLPVFRAEPRAEELDSWAAEDLGLLGPQLPPGQGTAPGATGAGRTLLGLIDWSSTIFGSLRLRRMLLQTILGAEDIKERQGAVREAARATSARERLLGALLPLREHDLRPVFAALEAPLHLGRRRGLELWTHLAGTLAPAVLLALAVFGDPRLGPPGVLLLLANAVTIGLLVKTSNPSRERLLVLGPLIQGILRLERELTAWAPSSIAWTLPREALGRPGPATRRLARALALLELHSFGPLFELWNLITLWELRILPVAERILERSRVGFRGAVGAVGEVEALVCLSLPLAERPDFELPEPLPGSSARLEAEWIGHPLIAPGLAVRNPVELGSEKRILIVTGSNMAGKSTYLKSIGLNAALAGAGGPVCARGFRWTPAPVLTDINVRDSLDDGKSYFQVEVERVRTAIERSGRSPPPVLLLDELFRGTNSEERLALVRAILRHLRDAGAAVVLATHDQALTRLVSEEREPGMSNAHFRETVEGAEMRFDYTLRPGPAETRNAIRVLEALGYPRTITEAARRESGAAASGPGGGPGATPQPR